MTAVTTTEEQAAGGTPTSTLLRRYTIVPGYWEAFLDVWRQIVQLRRRHGFSVVVAMADREEAVFTWVVQYTGDLQQAMDRYYADPDRVALEHVSDHVSAWDVREVEMVIPERP